MQKKILFLGNFYFPQKKGHFRTIFRDGQSSVADPGPTPSPWSISNQVINLHRLKFEMSAINQPNIAWMTTNHWSSEYLMAKISAKNIFNKTTKKTLNQIWQAHSLLQ